MYLTNTAFYRSTDSGKTFVAIKGAPGGDDYHTVWIDPGQLRHDRPGERSRCDDFGRRRPQLEFVVQPTHRADVSRIADQRFPFWVCGGQQESGSACVSSRGAWGQVTQRDWHTVGAQEYGYVVPDPLHAGVFFGGKVERFDERTGQAQEVSPIALPSKTYRTVRTEPLAFDRFDKHRLYFGANVVFQSDDGGARWRAISPDLTRPHPGIPAVLGAFEADDPQRGGHRGVVYAIAPSYRQAGTIWAGTDDGLVWITRNGGARWKNVTPPALTPWSKISQIDASRFEDGTAFVAVNRFRLDDLRPYVYVTRDGGAHWKLPLRDCRISRSTRCAKIPKSPACSTRPPKTASGFRSTAATHWQSLQLDLPHTSVRDLIVARRRCDRRHARTRLLDSRRRDAVTRTRADERRAFRRGKPRRVLFAPEPTYRVRNNVNTDTPLPPEEPAGQNPPDGAILDYALSAAARRVVLRSTTRTATSSGATQATIRLRRRSQT